MLEPLDGNLLEEVLAMPDHKDLLWRINAQINILPDQVQMNIIASFSNACCPILTHLPHEMLPVNLRQPSVRIHERGKSRQAGQGWKGHTWWLVATGECLIGSLGIVVAQEGCRDLTHLLKGLGTMDL